MALLANSSRKQDLRHLDIPGLGDKTRKTGLFRCARGAVVVQLGTVVIDWPKITLAINSLTSNNHHCTTLLSLFEN